LRADDLVMGEIAVFVLYFDAFWKKNQLFRGDILIDYHGIALWKDFGLLDLRIHCKNLRKIKRNEKINKEKTQNREISMKKFQ